MKRYIVDYSLKNGLGRPAVSVYLKGCDKKIKCSGCHNYEMQSIDDYQVSKNKLMESIDLAIGNFMLFHDDLRVAILGGEPLAPYNINITKEISNHIKRNYEGASVIIYTWRDIEDIQNEKIGSYLENVDYGILGSYKEEFKVENILPASSNQYIYDFTNNIRVEPILLKQWEGGFYAIQFSNDIG